MKTRSLRPVRRILTAVVLTIALPTALFAQQKFPERGKTRANVDVRIGGGEASRNLIAARAGQIAAVAREQGAQIARGVAALQARVPGAEVTTSPVTGAVEIVRSGGFLTEAAPGRSGIDIVRDFIRENSSLYGLSEAEIGQLRFLGESVSPGSGLRLVRVEQIVNGRPVFQSETRFTLNREGRLARSVGLIVPNASAAAAPLEGLIPAQAALKAALASVDIAVDESALSEANRGADGKKLELVANQKEISRPVPSEVVYFPVAPGVLVPAWSQVTLTSTEVGDWYTLVDAQSGALLWRKNIRSRSRPLPEQTMR